jgi:hypothetical protein
VKRLVFAPLIGFRPPGTRTLREPAETTVDGTRLIVLAAAAAPDRTDLMIEWERTGDPATCPPNSQLLVHTNMAPLEHGLEAELVVGSSRVKATTARRRAMHVSHPSIGAVDALSFPELPGDADRAELRITEGGTEWHLPFALVPGELNATALNVELERGGVLARATAFSRHDDKLIVALEVAGPKQIRQAGAPVLGTLRFSNTSDDDHEARVRANRRIFGEQSRPITLEVDHGPRLEETGRLFSFDPQQDTSGRHPYVNRFVVAFDTPGTDVERATLVIPFVELNDFEPSATADLRELPLDVALAEHRFRVVAVEPHGPDQRKITMELPASTAAPRFVQPARLQGSDPQFGWERHAVDAELPDRDAIWMATKVGDPPIVTFKGAVMRVDGPLRLELPLA